MCRVESLVQLVAKLRANCLADARHGLVLLSLCGRITSGFRVTSKMIRYLNGTF